MALLLFICERFLQKPKETGSGLVFPSILSYSDLTKSVRFIFFSSISIYYATKLRNRILFAVSSIQIGKRIAPKFFLFFVCLFVCPARCWFRACLLEGIPCRNFDRLSVISAEIPVRNSLCIWKRNDFFFFGVIRNLRWRGFWYFLIWLMIWGVIWYITLDWVAWFWYDFGLIVSWSFYLPRILRVVCFRTSEYADLLVV